jgi:hypothetical protein
MMDIQRIGVDLDFDAVSVVPFNSTPAEPDRRVSEAKEKAAHVKL